MHEGVPSVPGLGDGRRHLPVRSGAPRPGGVRHLAIRLLARAVDPEINEAGQDGGLVSALLIYALETGVIDAALVSYLEGDGTSWKAVPGVASNRARCSTPPAPVTPTRPIRSLMRRPIEGGAERIALVGMSCQSSAPPVMAARKAGKVARRFALTIGLLCSKTFDDAIFDELFEARYGLARQDIVKMNIKGVIQVWTRDGGYHEVPLKEAHAWTREGCKACPDFAAEHADISTGGIGAFGDWTLTVVRTEPWPGARGADGGGRGASRCGPRPMTRRRSS